MFLLIASLVLCVLSLFTFVVSCISSLDNVKRTGNLPEIYPAIPAIDVTFVLCFVVHLVSLTTFAEQFASYDQFVPHFFFIIFLIIQCHALWIIPWMVIWQWRKRECESRLKAWTLFQKERFQRGDKQILAKARKRAVHLCAMIDGVEWVCVRENIQQLANATLPQLLTYRQDLKSALKSVVAIIAEGELDRSPMGVELLQKTRADEDWFKQMLEVTESRISESLATLLHIETDVRRALLSRSQLELEIVTQKLAGLNASVGQTSRAIQAADVEVLEGSARQANMLTMRSGQ